MYRFKAMILQWDRKYRLIKELLRGLIYYVDSININRIRLF